MRQTLFAIFLILSFNVNAQLHLEKISDSSILRIMNNFISFKQFEKNNLSIKIFQVANEVGSAKLPESDEVTNDIYIAVSEIDTYPQNALFCIKNLYGITEISPIDSDSEIIIIGIKYVDISIISKPFRRTARIKVALQNVEFLN